MDVFRIKSAQLEAMEADSLSRLCHAIFEELSAAPPPWGLDEDRRVITQFVESTVASAASLGFRDSHAIRRLVQICSANQIFAPWPSWLTTALADPQIPDGARVDRLLLAAEHRTVRWMYDESSEPPSSLPMWLYDRKEPRA
ncbi:MAG: hypothetical protein MUF00_12130 [Gemmatimonadaceae bacterium]|jgi:hypothetical protein|nr:hypothetical protein [Gemmatimonadaceae bacterium]